jgi:hypothetical protein
MDVDSPTYGKNRAFGPSRKKRITVEEFTNLEELAVWGPNHPYNVRPPSYKLVYKLVYKPP